MKALCSSAAEVLLFLPLEAASCCFFVSVSKVKEGKWRITGQRLSVGLQVGCGCHLGNRLAFLPTNLQITIQILPHIPAHNLVHGKM